MVPPSVAKPDQHSSEGAEELVSECSPHWVRLGSAESVRAPLVQPAHTFTSSALPSSQLPFPPSLGDSHRRYHQRVHLLCIQQSLPNHSLICWLFLAF